MSTTPQPHDRFVRKMLGDLDIAADFFRHYADDVSRNAVDWANLKSLPKEYFGEFFDEKLADLLYSAPLVQNRQDTLAFVLAEHKSYADSAVMLQIGLYLFLAWSRFYREMKRPNLFKKPLPAPVILILYHGKEPFNPPSLRDIVAKIDGLERFVPDFSPWCVDLSQMDFCDIKGEPPTRAMIEALKRAADQSLPESLGKVFRHFKGLVIGDRVREWIKNILYYADCIKPLKRMFVQNVLQEVFSEKEADNMTMTLFEELEVEGKTKGKVEDTLTILETRFGEVPEAVQEAVTEIRDMERLESLIKKAVTCQSLAEFQKALE